MTISNPEIKKLYGRSAGRCNICSADVFENDVHIGEMAHIIAKSTNGPRGDEQLTGGINSYENLILLCANHHSEVDQNSQRYSIERLHIIKSEHEKNVASLFKNLSSRTNDEIFLQTFMDFVPFIKLRFFVEYLPRSVNLDICLVKDMFEAIQIDNPHLYPLNDQNLQRYFDNFIKSYYALWNAISGYTEANGACQANFSQADERNYLHMEKRYLPYKSICELSEEIENLTNSFIESYTELINFLRSNYKNINLNSHKPN